MDEYTKELLYREGHRLGYSVGVMDDVIFFEENSCEFQNSVVRHGLSIREPFLITCGLSPEECFEYMELIMKAGDEVYGKMIRRESLMELTGEIGSSFRLASTILSGF